jgi:hypothetical protein
VRLTVDMVCDCLRSFSYWVYNLSFIDFLRNSLNITVVFMIVDSFLTGQQYKLNKLTLGRIVQQQSAVGCKPRSNIG